MLHEEALAEALARLQLPDCLGPMKLAVYLGEGTEENLNRIETWYRFLMNDMFNIVIGRRGYDLRVPTKTAGRL